MTKSDDDNDDGHQNSAGGKATPTKNKNKSSSPSPPPEPPHQRSAPEGNAAVMEEGLTTSTSTKKTKKKKRKKKGDNGATTMAQWPLEIDDGSGVRGLQTEMFLDFWRGLSDEEKQKLSRLPKDEVPRRLKEQQKYSCNCSSCVRKRLIVEDELNSLYDQFLEEISESALFASPPDDAIIGEFDWHRALALEGEELFLTDYVLEDDAIGLPALFEHLDSPRNNLAGIDDVMASDDPTKNPGLLIDADRLDDDKGDDLTLEERKAQGKWCFQLIGIKMIQQKIMSAYKEKIALEKQRRLIEEEELELKENEKRMLQKEAAKEKKRQKRARQRQTQLEEQRKLAEEKRKEEEHVKAKELEAS
eukprot:m.202124 g.202124  ORF g.202124 m.202124 type:complete len:360 (+) comp15748_c2_seq2:361-1440(+)